MEQGLARKIARELKVDITLIVREYWEVLLLKELFDSPFGKELIFKGGTALRIVYGSPRFSEDLDFSLERDRLKGKFERIIKGIIMPYSELSITDIAEKYFTYLAEIKVTINYLTFPFRIKIEISKREQKNYKTELRLINSNFSPLQVIGRVATIEQIYKDKLMCIKSRAKPKDLFDLWFVCQKLKISYKRPDVKLPKSILRRDLRKILPSNYWNVIEEL